MPVTHGVAGSSPVRSAERKEFSVNRELFFYLPPTCLIPKLFFMEKILFILLIVIVSVSFVFQQLVDYLNSKHWCNGLPDSLKSIITFEQYEKSIKYYKQNENISRINEWFSFVLLITAL